MLKQAAQESSSKRQGLLAMTHVLSRLHLPLLTKRIDMMKTVNASSFITNNTIRLQVRVGYQSGDYVASYLCSCVNILITDTYPCFDSFMCLLAVGQVMLISLITPRAHAQQGVK